MVRMSVGMWVRRLFVLLGLVVGLGVGVGLGLATDPETETSMVSPRPFWRALIATTLTTTAITTSPATSAAIQIGKRLRFCGGMVEPGAPWIGGPGGVGACTRGVPKAAA